MHNYRNTLMTVFAQAFLNDHNNMSDAIKRSVHSAAIPSRKAKSHDFFDALGGIYSQNAFPSPIIRITLCRTNQKAPQASVKNFFLRIKGFLFEIWILHYSFLMRYIKMRI